MSIGIDFKRFGILWASISLPNGAKWHGKEHNEVALWILQMVYVEVFLGVDVYGRTISRSVLLVHREIWVHFSVLPEWKRVGGIPQVTPCIQPILAQPLQLGDRDSLPINHYIPMMSHENQATPPPGNRTPLRQRMPNARAVWAFTPKQFPGWFSQENMPQTILCRAQVVPDTPHYGPSTTMDVDMRNVILDAILDDWISLDVACWKIERLKVEVERTEHHHATQLRDVNEMHAAKLENLLQQLVALQMAHEFHPLKLSWMSRLDTKRQHKWTKARFLWLQKRKKDTHDTKGMHVTNLWPMMAQGTL